MAKDAPIEFKGTSLKIIQARLDTPDLAQLDRALADLTGHSPDFFENELAILDFSQATDLPEKVDWVGVRRLLRTSGLHAVATLGLPPALAADALKQGLPEVSPDALSRMAKPVRQSEAAETVPVPPPAEVPPPAAPVRSAPEPETPQVLPTMVIDKPLRSGQRIYARGGDLIVTAMVSAGAEVIADGNIHIYAPLRGRALAGASGDKSARIFTTCMEAELVSVAGLYRTFETGVPAELSRQPTLISLLDERGQARLHVAPLPLR